MAQNHLFTKTISFIRRKTSQKFRFNLQYEHKKWDGLHGLNELGHYSIITGYARHFCPGGSILDLGCGEGVLREKFSAADYSLYLGIDFSDVAINNAASKQNDKTRFIVGDLNHLVVKDNFDVIVYNESLYYLRDPQHAVRSLFGNLNPGGIFIFSIVHKHGKDQDKYWMLLDEILELQDSTTVTNLKGDSWTIKVYKLKT